MTSWPNSLKGVKEVRWTWILSANMKANKTRLKPSLVHDRETRLFIFKKSVIGYQNTFKSISIYSRLWKCHFQDFGNVISKPFLVGARSSARACFPKLWKCHFQTFSCGRAFLRPLILANTRSCVRASLRARARSFAKLRKWHFQNYLQKIPSKKNKNNNNNKRQSHF